LVKGAIKNAGIRFIAREGSQSRAFLKFGPELGTHLAMGPCLGKVPCFLSQHGRWSPNTL